MSALMNSAPALDPNQLDQIAALPLGGRVKLNPWDDQLIKTFHHLGPRQDAAGSRAIFPPPYPLPSSRQHGCGGERSDRIFQRIKERRQLVTGGHQQKLNGPRTNRLLSWQPNQDERYSAMSPCPYFLGRVAHLILSLIINPAINNYRAPAFRVKQRKAAQTSGG
jgi:hypothetical protein